MKKKNIKCLRNIEKTKEKRSFKKLWPLKNSQTMETKIITIKCQKENVKRNVQLNITYKINEAEIIAGNSSGACAARSRFVSTVCMYCHYGRHHVIPANRICINCWHFSLRVFFLIFTKFPQLR